MNALNQSAFLKALGWSLLDSFWQMGLLWLMYILLTRNGKRFQSTQRHSLALLSLAGGSLWFLITLIVHFNQVINRETVTDINFISAGQATAAVSFKMLEPLLPYFSLAYLSAIIYLFIRLYRQYFITQKLFSTGTHKVKPELRVFLNQIVARMGLKKNISIWLSDLVDTPLTIGFWKPVILLPVAVINHLNMKQAEAIVLHELNHIRRNDYMINLLIACMDIILFFNPFVRILTHIIKTERENSCDDMVLQFRYDAGQYASALLLLEKNRLHTPALTIAATGNSKKLLLNRVERILNRKCSNTAINQKLVAYLLSAFLISFIGWYNPGKMIEKTIDTVKNTAFNIEAPEQLNFPSPEFVKEAPLTNPNSITRKKKVQTNRPSQNSFNENDQPEQRVAERVTEEMPEESDYQRSSPSVMSYIGAESEIREYSISEYSPATEPNYSADVHPYIPSTSFSYHLLEDTALPKKYIPTQSEIKAKEAMTTALKALQEIDWQKLEKEMTEAGKKIDIIKLQQELKKAITDVDWKKINEEIQSSLIQTENELMREHTSLRKELQKFQEDRTAKLAQQQKIHKAIIQERLCDEKVQETKQIKKKAIPKKKIVYI